ncbi:MULTISPECIES: Era-like GTP-binding protein [Pseudanabaena]|uniref:Small GTP-binding protein n=2 Tax=Pseudanabaena TaxID=1152 RepID=L8N8A6_9CYAN|nr:MULTISPECIES: Era-like GTP-binding protein [Pseudanabaena]ELS34468.1 small GTP-binding protein [Pseudanabaena biceps PCC 7429]MDG3493337.1 Era-like GTP-binding protein [Pseudanabaena catenata USMAC16]
MQDYPQQVRDRLINYRQLFQKELIETELSQISTLEEKLDKTTIAIAVFGMVSRGKSSIVNALLGQKLSETGATHGITQDIAIYTWNASNKIQLQLIDTQGIDEVGGEERAAIALATAKQADLILFTIAGDMTRLEQEAIANLQKFYKPILLVFNKVDLYPDCDRLVIYQSLQSPELQKLISPEEIILVSAEPKPVKVRVQYSDGRSQEIWEPTFPDIQDLKQRILDLLNIEGKELLAMNVLLSLLEIQNSVTHRHLAKLRSATAIAAAIFITEAIGVLISPLPWLDGAISFGFNGLLALWAIGKYPTQRNYLWLMAIIAIACGTGGLGIQNEIARYIQILGAGLSIHFLFQGLMNDIDHSRASGMWGAKNLIADILRHVSSGSILQRFHQSGEI